MKPLGLRAKLTLSYAALFSVVLITIGGLFYQAVIIRLNGIVDERLQHLSTGLWGYMDVREGQPTAIPVPDDPEVRHFVNSATRYFQLYDGQNGRLLAQSEKPPWTNATLSQNDVARLIEHPGFDEVSSERGRLRVRNGVFHVGGHPYLLRVGMRPVVVDKARQQIASVLFVLFVPGVLLAGMGGWYMARHVLNPVKQLRIAAHEIGISQLNHRLPLRGTRDELDELAQTFNQVFARLEESVGNMKQFTASISHELRTPLAALQGEAEIALMRPHLPEEYRRVLASQLEEFQKLSRLVNQLLELARAEAGEIQLTKQEFELSALLHSLGDLMDPIAASQSVSLEVRCTDSIQLVGDAPWLQRAFLNLLDNAIKFTPESGHVRMQAERRGDYAAVVVSDTGIGIPQEAMPHIFERFYRGNLSRSRQVQGIGLGLAIAKWIVEAHHGSIRVESQCGVGSCFTVVLPATPHLRPKVSDRNLIHATSAYAD